MAKSNVFRGNFGAVAAAPKGKVPAVVTGSVVNRTPGAGAPKRAQLEPLPAPKAKAQTFEPPPAPAPKIQPPTSSSFGPNTPPPNGSVVQVVVVKEKAPAQEAPPPPKGEVKAPTPSPVEQQWKEKPSAVSQESQPSPVQPIKPPQTQQVAPPPDPYFITTEALPNPPKQTSQTQTPATATGGGPNFVLPKTTGAKDPSGLRNTGVQTLAQKSPEEMKGILFPAIGGAGVGYFAWKHGGLSPVVSAILALVAYVGVDFALKMKPKQ